MLKARLRNPRSRRQGNPEIRNSWKLLLSPSWGAERETRISRAQEPDHQ